MTSSTTPPHRRPRHLTTLSLLAAGVLALLFLTSGPAFGHASVAATRPADGASVDELQRVEIEFNEAVSVPPGGIRVFDEDAARVDSGTPIQLDDRNVAVDVRPDLPEGQYIVTWRAVSEDGHPIRGAFVYSVGVEGDVDEELLAELFSGDSGDIVAAAAALLRGVGYAGTLLAGGALAYLFWVAGEERERRRASRWARSGAWIGAVAALLTIPLQAMAVTGFGPVQALAPDVLGPVLVSSTGQSAIARLLALFGAAVLLRRGARRAAAVLGAVAVASFAVDGHTRTVEPLWFLITGDLVHVAAAAVWFGGLIVLINALRDRSFDDDPVGAAHLVGRYSSLATWSVVAVTVAGLAMSWGLVRQPRALTSTTYGWVLIAKVAVALAIIGLGFVNNRRLVPAVARAATPVPAGGSVDTGEPPASPSARDGWHRLRRTTRVEASAMVLLLAITGFLVNIRPAAESAGITGVFETTQALTEDLTVNLVVDPNRAGRNAIHVYLLDATGRPTDAVEDVTFRLRLPERDIGPIERETFVAGPGHWQLDGNELSIAGEWVIEVVVRIDRFTEETISIPVVVNPA